MAYKTAAQKDAQMMAEMRLQELRRKPKPILGVQFIYHNGLHFQYRCEYAAPMIGAATTLKECIQKRNDAIKNRIGPFILSDFKWPENLNMVKLVEKLFFEVEGVVYWNVAYITDRKVYYAGDIAETKYKYCQIKVMGRTLMSHNIVWCIHNKEWYTGIKRFNGNTRDNRIQNLY